MTLGVAIPITPVNTRELSLAGHYSYTRNPGACSQPMFARASAHESPHDKNGKFSHFGASNLRISSMRRQPTTFPSLVVYRVYTTTLESTCNSTFAKPLSLAIWRPSKTPQKLC